MKFSLNSLSQFIDLKNFYSQPNTLADRLSSAGFEVEGWEIKQLKKMVTAEIKSKRAHPQADRLNLCEVESKPGQMHSLVCGADNFQTGDKVVLALPGAVIASTVIKSRKIRGEISEGMLLSLSELGLLSAQEEEKGILILPQKTENGLDFASYIGLNDVIFEVDILPHRPDVLSHFGLSRELACILPEVELSSKMCKAQMGKAQTGKPPEKPVYSRVEGDKESDSVLSSATTKIAPKLSVQVQQSLLSPRYTGQIIYGVQVKPSPLWLKALLKNLTFKSINNVVDITNYCLLQWGQPLHAFDLDQIGKKIIVGLSQKGEKFVTLNDQELTLTGQELCIQDETKPLALAGVIGGSDSGIHKDTKNIFLESACFTPATVRASSKRFQIETDSSYRFSRGVSAQTTLNVLRKATALIQNLAGGKRAEKEYDIKEKLVLPKPIAIKTSDVSRRLSMSVSPLRFQHWMKKLGCQVDLSSSELSSKSVSPADSKDSPNVEKDQTIRVTPPLFRFDLKIKEDLIEEYARLESYDKIPEIPHYANMFPKEDHKEFTLLSRVSLIIAHEGFYQAINHSFISQAFSNDFLKGATGEMSSSSTENVQHNKNFLKIDPLLRGDSSLSSKNLTPVFIQNPLSQKLNMMRVSLLPSLFKNAQKNLHSGVDRGRLFEVGKVFYKQVLNPQPHHKAGPDLARSPYREDTRISFIAWGQKEELWEKHQDRLCFYDLKTVIWSILTKLNIMDYEWSTNINPPAFVHPLQHTILKIKGKTVAYIGSLHPEYAEHYKIRTNMALGELNTDLLISHNTNTRNFKKISSFPAVKRDLTFILPKDFPAGDISKAIKKIAGPICYSVKIFDIYENKTERAVSFRLHLQSDIQTLTEKVLTKLQNKLIQEIPSRFPAKLRQK